MSNRLFHSLAVVTLIFAAALAAQPAKPPVFNHGLSPGGHEFRPDALPAAAPETTRILITLVEFQEDADDRTTGNGRFDLSSSSKKIIDAPPHDRSYIINHLTFVSNYFRKVSDGKHHVSGTVLDSIVRLSNPMSYYSPPKNSENNAELGTLVRDAWRRADSLMPGTPFGMYDAFMIVHAGAGRDIDLVSIFGYDPTPFDIPSIYLNLNGLRKIFGPEYEGVPVSGGVNITNTMIIPETENREFPVIGGTALLELGINGLLVASVGSHLGLPDLFDTKTGRSGIGRFGLMDGQSIFSWNGIFPPEPSAWEKVFLGWVTPIEASVGEHSYRLPAVSGHAPEDTILHVPVSRKEYFLLENRNRDANRDGSTVTMVYNGETIVRTFPRDTTDYNAFDQDSLFGVIIDVDEFDWSLPGGVNARTNEFFDGGLLIWHIDETVIDAGYLTAAVNANPDRRGVDVEEADGSQDIGQSYAFLTAGSGSEDGTALDFWYDGNESPVRLLSNTFTPSSEPSSESYDRANSHLYVTGFSPRGPAVTFTVRLGDDEVEPMSGFPKKTGRTFSSNPVTVVNSQGAGVQSILVATTNVEPVETRDLRGLPGTLPQSFAPPLIYGWNEDGSPFSGFPAGNVITGLQNPDEAFFGAILSSDINNDQILDIAAVGLGTQSSTAPPRVLAWSLRDEDANGSADPLYSHAITRRVTTSPVQGDTFIAVGTQRCDIYFLTPQNDILPAVNLDATDTSDISGICYLGQSMKFAAAARSGLIATLTPAGIEKTAKVNRKIVANPVSGTLSTNGEVAIVFATADGYIYLTDGNLNVFQGFPVYTDGEILSAPAFADFDGDGRRDIIALSGTKIVALNSAGAYLDGFPLKVQTDETLPGSPIVADVNGDRIPDVVAVARSGLTVAYDRSGRMVPGFPLLAGTNAGSTPAVLYMRSPCLSCVDIGLVVASEDGYVYGWRTGRLVTGPSSPPPQPWPQYLHDAQNSGFDDSPLILNPRSGEFCPASLAYNWPNPVGPEHQFTTHIRYFVRNDATVRISVYDLAGDLVDSFTGPGRGGLDNEVAWDVSRFQSGVYFARIEAAGTNGSGTVVIKIAVVK